MAFPKTAEYSGSFPAAQLPALAYRVVTVTHDATTVELVNGACKRIGARHVGLTLDCFSDWREIINPTGLSVQVAVVILDLDAVRCNELGDALTSLKSAEPPFPRIIAIGHRGQLDGAGGGCAQVDDYRLKESMTLPELAFGIWSAVRRYEVDAQSNAFVRQTAMIPGIGRAILDQQALHGSLQVALKTAAKIFGASNGFIFLPPFHDLGTDSMLVGMGKYWGAMGRVLQEIQEIIDGGDTRSLPGSRLALPVRGEPSGVLYLADGIGIQDSVKDLLASHISVAIGKVVLRTTLANIAERDAETDLPNRLAIEAEIDWLLQKGEQNLRLCLLYVETLQEVEAVFGAKAGVAMVREIAQAFKQEDVIIGRLDHDTLAIIDSRCEACTQHCTAKLKTVPLNDTTVPIGFSAGNCIIDEAGDGKTAVRWALAALHKGRRSRQGIGASQQYHESITIDARQRLELLSNLRRAADVWDGFAVVYQPQVNLCDGAIIGAEALLRWSSGGESIAPGVFIELAEASGDILALGYQVIREAFKQVAAWRGQGHSYVVAVNLSPLQLNEANFANKVTQLAVAMRIEPGWIEFELTESHATSHAIAVDVLKGLRSAGFTVAIDDFGTGYSSLERLASLPFDRIKIDQTFVASAHHSIRHRKVCESAILLSKALGLKVLAEGIETDAQRQMLMEMGCLEGQGFLFGTPMAPERFHA